MHEVLALSEKIFTKLIVLLNEKVNTVYKNVEEKLLTQLFGDTMSIKMFGNPQ